MTLTSRGHLECLQTFLVVTPGRQCCWHLVGRGRQYCYQPARHRTAPDNRIIRPQISTVPWLKNTAPAGRGIRRKLPGLCFLVCKTEKLSKNPTLPTRYNMTEATEYWLTPRPRPLPSPPPPLRFWLLAAKCLRNGELMKCYVSVVLLTNVLHRPYFIKNIKGSCFDSHWGTQGPAH